MGIRALCLNLFLLKGNTMSKKRLGIIEFCVTLLGTPRVKRNMLFQWNSVPVYIAHTLRGYDFEDGTVRIKGNKTIITMHHPLQGIIAIISEYPSSVIGTSRLVSTLLLKKPSSKSSKNR